MFSILGCKGSKVARVQVQGFRFKGSGWEGLTMLGLKGGWDS
jgi:hypothetical protein